MSQKLQELSGYAVLPVKLPGSFFSRHLYVRKHAGKADDEQLPKDRTLFVANAPHNWSSEQLRVYFGSYGAVTAVKTADDEASVEEGTANSCHVVFSDAVSVTRVLLGNKKASTVAARAASAIYQSQVGGMEEMLAEYKAARPGHEELKKEVDKYMHDYGLQEQAAQDLKESQHNTVDADGFTLVTRKKGRSTTTDASSSAADKKGGVSVHAARSVDMAAMAARKPAKNQAKVDFYRFQQREARKSDLQKLRDGFEKDKKKIIQMREQRKFRPF